MSTKSKPKMSPREVLLPSYQLHWAFSNWGDIWYPKVANRLLLTPISKLKFITPNMVSIFSFAMFVLGCIAMVIGGNWAYWTVFLLPFSYITDCLDGQLARYTGKSSAIGDYLDKTLDVIKLFIINAAMGLAAFNLTGHYYFLLLSTASLFGFLFRYYIKLEIMFVSVNKDKDYMDKSRARRDNLYKDIVADMGRPKTLRQRLNWLWFRHHSMFALDESEHITFGALAALAYRPDLWCWVFGIGQLFIAFIRLFERGNQLLNNPDSLTYPLRK